MNRIAMAFVLCVVSFILFTIEPAAAGPGGKIATVMLKSFWGRVVLIALVIFFLPLIFYDSVILALAKRRARKDLAFISTLDPRFEWLNIKERVSDCFTRTHDAWQKENLDDLSGWMADWYIKNQQMVYLDKWKNEGLKNICEVRRIVDMEPVLFLHRNDTEEHGGSKLVVSITANMEDYLARFEDGEEVEIVEGMRGFHRIATLWTFTFANGMWIVSNIEEAIKDDKYARYFKKLPKIEDTILAKTEKI